VRHGAPHRVVLHCTTSHRDIPVRPSPQRERSSRVLFSCFRLALVQLHNGHAHTCAHVCACACVCARACACADARGVRDLAGFSRHTRACSLTYTRCASSVWRKNAFVETRNCARYNSLKCTGSISDRRALSVDTWRGLLFTRFYGFRRPAGVARACTHITVSRKIILRSETPHWIVSDLIIIRRISRYNTERVTM